MRGMAIAICCCLYVVSGSLHRHYDSTGFALAPASSSTVLSANLQLCYMIS